MLGMKTKLEFGSSKTSLHRLICAKCKTSYWYPDQICSAKLSCGHGLCKYCFQGLREHNVAEFRCEHLPADKGRLKLGDLKSIKTVSYSECHAIVNQLRDEIAKIRLPICTPHNAAATHVSFVKWHANFWKTYYLCDNCEAPEEATVWTKAKLQKRLEKVKLDTPRFDILIEQLCNAFSKAGKHVSNENEMIKQLYDESRSFWDISLEEVFKDDSFIELDPSDEISVVRGPRLETIAGFLVKATQIVEGRSENWETEIDSIWASLSHLIQISPKFDTQQPRAEAHLDTEIAAQTEENQHSTPEPKLSAVSATSVREREERSSAPQPMFSSYSQRAENTQNYPVYIIDELFNRIRTLENDNKEIRQIVERYEHFATKEMSEMKIKLESVSNTTESLVKNNSFEAPFHLARSISSTGHFDNQRVQNEMTGKSQISEKRWSLNPFKLLPNFLQNNASLTGQNPNTESVDSKMFSRRKGDQMMQEIEEFKQVGDSQSPSIPKTPSGTDFEHVSEVPDNTLDDDEDTPTIGCVTIPKFPKGDPRNQTIKPFPPQPITDTQQSPQTKAFPSLSMTENSQMKVGNSPVALQLKFNELRSEFDDLRVEMTSLCQTVNSLQKHQETVKNLLSFGAAASEQKESQASQQENSQKWELKEFVKEKTEQLKAQIGIELDKLSVKIDRSKASTLNAITACDKSIRILIKEHCVMKETADDTPVAHDDEQDQPAVGFGADSICKSVKLDPNEGEMSRHLSIDREVASSNLQNLGSLGRIAESQILKSDCKAAKQQSPERKET